MSSGTDTLSFGAEHFGRRFLESSSERELLSRVETRLLLLAAMIDPPAELGSYVKQAIAANIDWKEFRRLAMAHRLLPFVAKSLGTIDAVPQDVRDRLLALARRSALRSLEGAASAQRARSALADAGIPSMVLKGPALSEMLYGDPAARMFVDIDLYVAPADLPTAVDVMRGLGYEPTSWSDWTPERLAIAARAFHAHDVELQDPNGGLRVELHWRAINHLFYDEAESALLKMLGSESGSSSRVPVSTQVLLHGANHGYRRLGWLRDAAALCGVLDDDEWSKVVDLANADSVPNAVLLGPYLAHRLFGVEPPESVAREIELRRGELSRLGGFSTMTTPDSEGIEERGALKMQLGLRDRPVDKAQYLLDKVSRLRRDQMNANTLQGGHLGTARRLAAQPTKLTAFVSDRLGPKVVDAVSRSGR